jgi:hypothetical protein
VKSTDLATPVVEDFVGADAAVDDPVSVVGWLLFAEYLGVSPI